MDAEFLHVATEAGVKLAREGYTVIYGGGRIGLMGALADAVIGEGGEVIGVIPRFLRDKEIAHSRLAALHLTETMHERQMGMAGRADAFVVLPGGLGTLAEFFEILTWRQLGLHNKPIMLVNSFGYWDSLLKFTEHAKEAKFLRPGDDGLFVTLENIDALTKYLSQL